MKGCQVYGRLSLRKGEGSVRVYPEAGCAPVAEPLTLILSPCARGEAKML
jgi:hypothetical protein